MDTHENKTLEEINKIRFNLPLTNLELSLLTRLVGPFANQVVNNPEFSRKEKYDWGQLGLKLETFIHEQGLCVEPPDECALAENYAMFEKYFETEIEQYGRSS